MKEIEIVEKRGLREKHFLQENGEIIAKIYSDDIHYLKDGKYEEIDNTLIEENESYTNKQNSFKVFLNKNTSKSIVKMEKSNHYLDIKLKKENNSAIIKGKKLNKFVEKVKYNDILDNIDFEYKVLPTKVKEAIVIKNRENIPEKLEFIVNTDLTLILNLDKSISAVRDGKEYFKIEAPYMLDTNGMINNNIYYELNKEGEKYKLNLILDSKWLNSGEITYPITIDPTITNSGQNTGVYDTYIYPGDDNAERHNKDILKAGVEKVNGQNIVNRTLIKFDLPTIGTGSQIVYGIVKLIGYPERIYDYHKTWFTAVHQVTAPWTEENAKWSTMNDKYNQRVETLFYSRNGSMTTDGEIDDPSIMYANITSLVKKWYSDTPNYGIMIKMPKEEYTDDTFPSYISKNNTIEGDNPQPVLIIRYKNQNGLESYMNYQKQSFNQGATYVNNYNGNLTAVFDIGKTIGCKLPINLELIYNTNDVILQNNIGYGLGYKLNYHQTIKETQIEEINYLEYVDADGTIHYFTEKDGIFVDEDGLNLKITKNSDCYILSDKSNNCSKFVIRNQIGYLEEILDVSGNKITICYNNNNIINKIIDSSNAEINIIYETNKITVVCPNQTIYLNYENNRLINVQKKTGTTAFIYNEQNLITKITDEDGLSTGYEYYQQTPYRIKKVREYGLNSIEGKYIDISYGFDSTTIVDNKNRANTIIFNSSGNVSSITSLKSKDNLEGAYGKREVFSGGENSFNKLSASGIPIKYVKNYMQNTSFENNNNNFFTDSDITMLITDEISVSGSKSLKAINNVENGTIYRNISVPKGKKYTFSAYLKNSNAIKIGLSYIDNNDMVVESFSDNITPSENFKRHDITIDYPDDAKSQLKVKLYLETLGILYIDDIQLEEGEVPNNYNIIENSDFSFGLDGWDINARKNSSPDSSGVTISDYFEVTEKDGNKALKIKMDPDVCTYLDKIINYSGKRGDLYNVSFWYKCEGIDHSYDQTFNNVVINFEETGGYGHGAVPSTVFNPNPDYWQYFSYNFVAIDDYTSLKLSFFQQMNANNLYITNISLFKDIRENYYEYDEQGNVTSVTSLNNDSNKFTYDKNNQLIKMTNPIGKSFAFEYDNSVNTRPLRSYSPSGIMNEIKYDVHGNPISTVVKNVGSIENKGSGAYKIRLKGTNKYLKNMKTDLLFEENDCCNNIWYIEKEGDYFAIKHPILQERYLSVLSHEIYFGSYQYDNSLYSLIKQDDNSYLIKCKLTNVYLVNYDGKLSTDGSPSEQVENRYKFYFEDSDINEFIENSAEYTTDGKHIKSTVDSNFNKTIYNINPTTGLMESTINAKNQEIIYTYNDSDRISSIRQGNKEIDYNYNEQHLINKITSGAKDFNFEYDKFLNVKNVKIGNDITLINNVYEENNGNLLSSTYGNNDSISYDYDDFDRLIKLNKMNNIYQYKYNNNSELVKVISNDAVKKYTYDVGKKLHEYEYNNFKIRYTYDKNDNIIKRDYALDTFNKNITSDFDSEGQIVKVGFDKNEINFNYDSLERLKNKNINGNYNTNYEYITKGKRTSNLLKSVDNNGDKYSYKYDKLNNITHIYHNNKLENKYYYNKYNELIKENNYEKRQTIRYIYDDEGNILFKRIYELNTYNLLEESNYEYTDSKWEDKLTKYNLQTITYDEIGNPLTIGNDVRLDWINGRELNSYIDSDNTISYKYNEEGLRTSKVVNNVETKYYLEENKIILEQTGNNMIYYIRNNLGNLLGIKYNNQIYHYIKNAQNDVIGLLDDNFNVVARYEYDSFGKILSIKDAAGNNIDSASNHIANINPFRYRSYYYDKETKLYYINSRYYNPLWGRFLNADGIINANDNVLGYNLFAYTGNNFISYQDLNGNFALSLTTASLVVLGGAVLLGGYVLLKGLMKASVPAIAETTQKISNALDNTKKQDKEKKEEKKETTKKTGTYSVYTLSSETKVEYVGRTNNYERRMREYQKHPIKCNLEPFEVASGLTYEEARGLEQILIDMFGTLNRGNPMNNQIRGVRWDHPNYDKIMEAGQKVYEEIYGETYVGG